MSEAAKLRLIGVDNPFWGKEHTDEARLWISEAAQLRPDSHYKGVAVTLTYIVTNEIKPFSSVTKAADLWKADKRSVRKSNEKLFRGQYFIHIATVTNNKKDSTPLWELEILDI